MQPHIPFTSTLFGATGYLSMRKILPALFVALREGKLHPDGRIICVAKKNFSRDDYLAWVRKSALPYIKSGFAGQEGDALWQSFLARISYFPIDLLDVAGYQVLAAALASNKAVSVFYLATSSSLFEPICANLTASNIDLSQARVVLLEKPLGHDLLSSHAITDEVARVFAEDQIYRIAHYLDNEAVQNLLPLRFANSLFEPLWPRESVAHVQLGVEGKPVFPNRRRPRPLSRCMPRSTTGAGPACRFSCTPVSH